MGMTPEKKRPERGAPVPAVARAADAAKKKPATAVAKADTKPAAKSAGKSEKSDKAGKPDKGGKPDKVADKSGAKKK